MNKKRQSGSAASVLWAEGTLLGEAWFFFAEEYAKNKYRNCSSQVALESQKILMEVDLFEKLFSGQLVAVGIRVNPASDVDPELIPAILFSERPHHSAGVQEQWSQSRLLLSARQWTNVRVCQPNMHGTKLPTQAAKSGRPPISKKLETITKALHEEGALNIPKRSEQYRRVRTEARRKHPGEPEVFNASDETLRKVFRLVGVTSINKPPQ